MASPQPFSPAQRSAIALLASLVIGFLSVLSINWYFEKQIEQIDGQLANERVHLFIGEQILLNTKYLELIAYKLAPAGKDEIYQKLLRDLDAAADQIDGYFQVMREGGTAREAVAHEPAHDQSEIRTLSYTANHGQNMAAMGVEFGRLLNQLKAQSRELVVRLNERDRCFRDRLPCVPEATSAVRSYFLEFPPLFQKLNHHAHFHLRKILDNLNVIDTDLKAREQGHRRAQVASIILIMLVVLILAGVWLRQMNRYQLRLLEAQRTAEAASDAKTRFLATVSHEIRTPLNGTLGMLDLLRDTRLEPEQRELVDDAKTSADSLLHLINEILDISRIEAGYFDTESTAFRPADLVEEIVAIHSAQARSKNLRLVLDLATDLPEWVVGDRLRIRQVLTNLMGNAIKFMDQGEVRLSIRRTEDGLHFEVRDTGIGIPESARDSLFKPFSQVDSSMTRRYGGTGLGLAISRKIVEHLGGKIDFSSELGKGSCFWIELPLPECAPGLLVLKSELGLSDGVSQAPAEQAGAPLAGRRILLVEDNLTNQKLAQIILMRLGCVVDLAVDGVEALAAVQARPYAAVLMDMQMPVMDGLEATQAIRQLGADYLQLPIIAVTANSMQSDQERCIEAGANDFISKPYTPATLAACLLRWTASPQPPRQLRPAD